MALTVGLRRSVGREVVQVGRGPAPVPQCQHDIALDALRPRRLRKRQFAFGDPVGPVAEILECQLRVEAADRIDHVGLACPDWMRRAQASAEVSKWPSAAGIVRVPMVPIAVTGDAAGGLYDVQPCLRDF